MHLFHIFSFRSGVGKNFFSPLSLWSMFLCLLQLNTDVSGPRGAGIIGDWGSRESEYNWMFYINFFAT